jgi:hypothetical protein
MNTMVRFLDVMHGPVISWTGRSSAGGERKGKEDMNVDNVAAEVEPPRRVAVFVGVAGVIVGGGGASRVNSLAI